MDKHILIFGTSITYGAWDSEGGWVARLSNMSIDLVGRWLRDLRGVYLPKG